MATPRERRTKFSIGGELNPLTAPPAPNFECRMYEARYPNVNTPVMIQVKEMGDVLTHVSLLEYNNIDGILFPLDRSRRSVCSLTKVGRIEPAKVRLVYAAKGYIQLSKKSLSEQDVKVCKEKYSKSSLVHSIMRHVAETMNVDLEDLYFHVGWPLYRKYGHAFEAFKLIVNDPDSVLNSLTREVKEIGSGGKEVTEAVPAISEDVKDALIRNIRRRMTPQPLKICADIEMKCFQFDGVLHIKEAMRQAEAVGTKECPVKIKLVAPPSYVVNTQTLDEEQGITIVNKAIAVCAAAIECQKGKLTVKEAPRAVSEREDKLLPEQMTKLGRQNEEADGTLSETTMVSTLHSSWNYGTVCQHLVNDVIVTEQPSEMIQSVQCEVCKITCNTKDVFKKHLQGKKHKNNLQMLSSGTVQNNSDAIHNESPKVSQHLVNDVIVTEQPSEMIQSIQCKVCKIVCNSKDVLEVHEQGKKHKKNLRLLSSVAFQNSSESNAAHNESPDQMLPDVVSLTMEGELEKKKHKMLQNGVSVYSLLFCKICNVVCNNQVVFNLHLAGRKHATQAATKLSNAAELSENATQTRAPWELQLVQSTV